MLFSHREAARYIETYKAYEHKPADLIKQRVAEDHYSQVRNNKIYTLIKMEIECANHNTG